MGNTLREKSHAPCSTSQAQGVIHIVFLKHMFHRHLLNGHKRTCSITDKLDTLKWHAFTGGPQGPQSCPYPRLTALLSFLLPDPLTNTPLPIYTDAFTITGNHRPISPNWSLLPLPLTANHFSSIKTWPVIILPGLSLRF